jgi:hypothetical protein
MSSVARSSCLPMCVRSISRRRVRGSGFSTASVRFVLRCLLRPNALALLSSALHPHRDTICHRRRQRGCAESGTPHNTARVILAKNDSGNETFPKSHDAKPFQTRAPKHHAAHSGGQNMLCPGLHRLVRDAQACENKAKVVYESSRVPPRFHQANPGRLRIAQPALRLAGEVAGTERPQSAAGRAPAAASRGHPAHEPVHVEYLHTPRAVAARAPHTAVFRGSDDEDSR